MKKSQVLILLLALASVIWLYSGCAASKNTGSAIGHAAKETGEEVNEVATDASITAAIKMKMADDETVSASNINVDTDNGHVVLKGTVRSSVEENRAIEIAHSAEGVKSVKSELVISHS